MEGTYEVQFGQKTVGTVRVSRQGLYYHISCRCRAENGSMLELMAGGSGLQERLGLLAPVDEGMGLDMKIPVKRLGEQVTFFLLPRGQASEELILVTPEKPFAHLQELERAYLVEQEGKMMIGLRKNKEKSKIRG